MVVLFVFEISERNFNNYI